MNKQMELPEIHKFFKALKMLPDDNIVYIEFIMLPGEAEIEYYIRGNEQVYGGPVNLSNEQEAMILAFMGFTDLNVFEIRLSVWEEGSVIVDLSVIPESRL